MAPNDSQMAPNDPQSGQNGAQSGPQGGNLAPNCPHGGPGEASSCPSCPCRHGTADFLPPWTPPDPPRDPPGEPKVGPRRCQMERKWMPFGPPGQQYRDTADFHANSSENGGRAPVLPSSSSSGNSGSGTFVRAEQRNAHNPFLQTPVLSHDNQEIPAAGAQWVPRSLPPR